MSDPSIAMFREMQERAEKAEAERDEARTRADTAERIVAAIRNIKNDPVPLLVLHQILEGER